ncbi:P-loop containing nucleoside triphosphate hydrolase protein [Westerdykella ornata]|uniref:P-loop containing nucleoside triphosphate hydrolase protein n=1 Tax=Westerdykella ornata TaxID=318751 RepID=A0A6A6JX14_WESOR|nr:P-loop containing nucleoside triphosphate hydrolase protein [Westerdykella ornata]KAF2280775.1 P-loop containing nucleoside triphosphate hydrolase protein [Westerdykella ornata]
MAFLRQTWTLTKKNLVVVFNRHWFFTSIRAFWAPIIFMFFITYAKNFFVPPSEFGIGRPLPILALKDALDSAKGGRDTVVFVNNGFTGGDIENVINKVSDTVREVGKNVRVVQDEVELLTICRSTLRGASTCFGAAMFHSSPTEGDRHIWNYTLRADGALGDRVFVNQDDNDVEIYILPLQRAIDTAIASSEGSDSPRDIDAYIFTDKTQKERDERIRTLYMGALIDIMGVALYVGICGVTYQLTGQMASEREDGVSQLIEAMAPSKRSWYMQAARLLSNHIAFDVIYLPGWIIMAITLNRLAFPTSSAAILIIYHILIGFALTSFSIFGASFFRKAQLSGITITILGIVLAIVAQVAGPFNTGATAILSLLFPSMNYVFFVIYLARFERELKPTTLIKAAPPYEGHTSTLPGIAFWVFCLVQTLAFPVLGAMVERWLYGTVSKERKTSTSSPDHSIILTNFSKHWRPTWFRREVLAKFGIHPPETVVAVNDLSLKARKGQVMVLLGANGSGKSTTLDAIAGLNTLTSGSIEIDGTGGLGLCPQKNVMWDDLTVFEHVQIFNRLKCAGKGDDKETIKSLIRACDLGHKMNAQPKTLSGGQKRKLQLAMMFTGGSRVCCVDEVSSGLDPLSRRKIWEILLAERGDRTFLLTTHFLDEADVLADYIAILSRGNLKTKGTSVQLKHEVGAGYHVTVPNNVGVSPKEAVRKPSAKGTIMYWFPTGIEATDYIRRLREKGINDYDLIGPTLEDVFLALAEEVKENRLNTGVVSTKDHSLIKEADGVPLAEESSDSDKGANMSKGTGTSMPTQTWILMQKRFTILRRNFLPYICAVLLPVITAGLVTLFLKDFEAIGCDPAAQADDPRVFTLASLPGDLVPLVPVGPSNLVDVETIARRAGVDVSAFEVFNGLDDFNRFVQDRFRNITPGGFFVQADGPAVMPYLGNVGVYGGLITLNALDNILTGVPIATQYQEFARPFAPNTGDSLQLVLYLGLAMCVYPAFFALYPTIERLRKVRALHYSNGIRAAPLWLAYLAFDFTFVVLISAIVTAILAGASSAWYAPGYLFLVFFLYGLTSILFSYLVSIVVTSQLATFAFAAGGQASLFLLYFIGYMSILTYAPAYQIDRYLEIFHFAFATITPSGNLLRTFLLSLNTFSILCNGNRVALTRAPLNGYKPPIFAGNKVKTQHTEEEIEAIDPAVVAEIKRTEACNDSLRVLHLHKTFGANHAVNNITFGVPRGQVFALLGPNGAGKSTTISLIRGDVHPNRNGGDVLIEDISIVAKRAQARGHLGVCPQFDAMDSMTVREHLIFYARARGVSDLTSNIEAVLSATGLTRFADRIAHKLSGGNKRKLSLGIALMGNPEVLLLDEPSSGMDAAAKRVMWRTLLGVAAPGRALLITTHSMEEADKLATRVGIMKRKMLALGSSAPETTEEEMEGVKDWVNRNVSGAQLDKWGSRGGGHGQLRFRVLKAAVHPNKEEHISEADIKRTPTQSSLTQNRSMDIGGIPGLIQLLETHREQLGLEYYSVSPTTLDEVFLRVVGDDEEDGTGKAKKRGLAKLKCW